MRRVLPFLVLGTSVLAAEVPARLSPEDRAALEAAPVPAVAGSRVRPFAVQREPQVSVATVEVTELLRVLTLPQRDPARLTVLTQTASVAVLLEALVATLHEPALDEVLLQAIPTDRRAEVLVGLVAMTRVNPQLELTLFALDIDHWVAVHHLLGEDEAPNSLYIGNWLGAWRLRLRQRIAREGYSKEVMEEFARMKEMLAKQPGHRSSGFDPAQ